MKEIMQIEEVASEQTLVVQTGVAGTALVFFREALTDMVPFLIAALVLCLVDVYFGVKAATRKGEVVRLSRAIRRTVSKIVEYFCWVTLSATLATAFRTEIIEWVILGLVMGNEVISVVTNFFASHGKIIRGLNIWQIVGDKAGVDLSGVSVSDVKESKKGKKHE